MKKVLIIGAGPAGLTAAYELLKTGEYDVTVLERSQDIGGISKTVRYRDNRMDIGGHRFFQQGRPGDAVVGGHDAPGRVRPPWTTAS